MKLGEGCQHYKTGFHDNELAETCKICRVQCRDEFNECDAAYRKKRKPKADNDSTLKIKRRRIKRKRTADANIEIETSYTTCEGPLAEYCEGCDKVIECLNSYLLWYSRIPHWILEKYLQKLSLCAFKIWVFLNRSANFDEDNKHFGRCWFKYSQIEAATGVSASNKYIDELEELGLIEHTLQRFSKNGQIRTAHEFTINWLKRMRALRKDVKKVWRNREKQGTHTP